MRIRRALSTLTVGILCSTLPASGQNIPADIMQEIRSAVESRYPDNYSMQKTLIDAQVEAYQFLQRYDPQGIPIDVLAGVHEGITAKYPFNFSMQQTLLEAQVEAYRYLADLEVQDMPTDLFTSVKKRISTRYPTNYSMQQTLIDADVEAWRALQGYSPSGIPAATLAEIKAKYARRYPSNHSMQQTLLENDVESYLELHGASSDGGLPGKSATAAPTGLTEAEVRALVQDYMDRSPEEGDQEAIGMVKGAVFSGVNPNTTVGEATDCFLKEPKWETGLGDDGTLYVNVMGQMQYQGNVSLCAMQFSVDKTKGTLQTGAMELNGVPMPALLRGVLFKKIMDCQ